MGNSQSFIYNRLESVMPAVDSTGWNSPATSWFDKSQKPFASDGDRTQFIHATITVLSQNGRIPLQDHSFRLLYSRRENERLVARIVAEKEGIVKAQIEQHEDGKDQAEAFRALRRHVELALDRILRDVPGSTGLTNVGGSPSAIAGPSSRVTSPRSPARGTVVPIQIQSSRNDDIADAPPAYGRAVRDWRSGEDPKKG